MTLTGKILNCTAADYYADRILDKSTLNYSTAKLMVTRSPWHAWTLHPKLGGQRSEATDATDMGNIIDSLMLEDGRGLVEVDADDFRTKAAKEGRDAARSAGKVPVISVKLQQFRAIASKFQKHLADLGIKLDGQSQVTVTWQEMGLNGPVDCRGRLDHFKRANLTIYDVKTTSGSAHPEACSRKIYEMGYDIQAVAYRNALERVDFDLAGRIKFVWLFLELEPPYCVTALRPSGTMWQLGETRWKRGVHLWEKCLKEDKWPGYVDGIDSVEPPAWAWNKELEQEVLGNVANV